jgi:hypothetical protein
MVIGCQTTKGGNKSSKVLGEDNNGLDKDSIGNNHNGKHQT